MTNDREAEIDAIRVKLYEETRALSREERVNLVNDKAQKIAAEFGFTIVPSASGMKHNAEHTVNAQTAAT